MGVILSTSDRNLVRKGHIDEETLKKVAELLGIPKAERDKLISDTRSIFIYRRTKRPPKHE